MTIKPNAWQPNAAREVTEHTITASRIRDRRKELRLTMQEVADQIGVTQSTVSRWENSVRPGISVAKIQRLAEILQCDANYLTGLEKQQCETDRERLHRMIDTLTDQQASELFRYALKHFTKTD